MNRACPVVLRIKHDNLELLAFEHPNGRYRLVKGGIKKGESLDAACSRELEEESGVLAEVVKPLGIWDAEFKDQVWGFCLMHFDDKLPEQWAFETRDDGGHTFKFFWQPLNGRLSDQWDEVYRRAFRYINHALSK